MLSSFTAGTTSMRGATVNRRTEKSPSCSTTSPRASWPRGRCAKASGGCAWPSMRPIPSRSNGISHATRCGAITPESRWFPKRRRAAEQSGGGLRGGPSRRSRALPGEYPRRTGPPGAELQGRIPAVRARRPDCLGGRAGLPGVRRAGTAPAADRAVAGHHRAQSRRAGVARERAALSHPGRGDRRGDLVVSALGASVAPQPAWMAFTGQSDEEMLGAGWTQAVHPDDRRSDGRSVGRTRSRAASHSRNEHRIRRHDGQWRWMRVHAAPIREPTARSSSGSV